MNDDDSFLLIQQLPVDIVVFLKKAAENHLSRVETAFEVMPDSGQGYLRRSTLRIAVNARTDAGKGNAFEMVGCRQLQGRGVARCQPLGFSVRTSPPYRPHRVNHLATRQTVSLRYLALPRSATAQGAALLQQLPTRRPMDSPVHTPAPKKRSIGRIDNSIHL